MEARAAVVTALVCAHRVQTVRYTFRRIPSQVEALLLPDLADHDPRRGIRDRGRRNAHPARRKHLTVPKLARLGALGCLARIASAQGRIRPGPGCVRRRVTSE